MAAIQYYDVILKPVITEKSMAGMSEKKYTFLVHPEANKTQIKEDVRGNESCEGQHHESGWQDEETWYGIRQDSQNQEGYRTADRGQQRDRDLRRLIRISGAWRSEKIRYAGRTNVAARKI